MSRKERNALGWRWKLSRDKKLTWTIGFQQWGSGVPGSREGERNVEQGSGPP